MYSVHPRKIVKARIKAERQSLDLPVQSFTPARHEYTTDQGVKRVRRLHSTNGWRDERA